MAALGRPVLRRSALRRTCKLPFTELSRGKKVIASISLENNYTRAIASSEELRQQKRTLSTEEKTKRTSEEMQHAPVATGKMQEGISQGRWSGVRSSAGE
jgi:hypothetical protein